MVFNKKITGFQNEWEFINYLNKRKIKELHPLFSDFIYTLFPGVKEEDIIYCYGVLGKQKGDLRIIIQKKTKYVSVKKGVKNSVHIESIRDFLSFLRKNQVPEHLIQQFLYYHYGDGTLDGTGTERLCAKELQEQMKSQLLELNRYLNQKTTLENSINRFVLLGNQSCHKIDAIILGVIDDFIWATSEEIKNIILEQADLESPTPHFGPLYIQPWNRCINHNSKYEKNRHYIQVKWYNLSDDMLKIMYQRNTKL